MILVLGSGAREHALIRSLCTEDAGHTVVAAPGNAGIASDVETVPLDPCDPNQVVAFAIERAVELVIVGPEAPLVAGVADAVRAAGIPVFGPDASAAQLEGSKTYAKRIMDAAGVPTGRAILAADIDAARTAIDEFGAPYVVKADGLAAGKGVLVTEDREAALAHVTHWLPHGSVLVEEFLTGPEVSLFFVSDGESVRALAPAQDFKRLGDDDLGPNTGGMGAYSPLPWLDELFGSEQAFVTEVTDTVALPTVRQMAAEHTPFIGLLYCGLILTPQGVRVIEFNARFGDPETQVVLPRLVTPLSTVLLAAATGTLSELPALAFSPLVAVTVVLASEGYPESPVTGRPITGLGEAAAVPGVSVLHAGTGLQPNDELVSAGGRVLSVVALGKDFGSARSRVYEAVSQIGFTGAQYRTDIAAGAGTGTGTK